MKKDDLAGIEALIAKGSLYKTELFGTVDGMKKWSQRHTEQATAAPTPSLSSNPATPSVAESAADTSGLKIKKVVFCFVYCF